LEREEDNDVTAAWSENFRIYLAHKMLTSICGLTLDEWLGLLRKHFFAVDPPYLPRAALMTGTSLVNSAIAFYEDRVYGSRVDAVEIQPPLFILGHQRSGTSHLQNLLSLDERFATPNVFQVLNPHIFLSTERFSRAVSFIAPKTRLIDNMKFGFDVPFEDEFSTVGSLHSPILWLVFPQWEDHYSRYLTFRGVPEEEIDRWRTSLVRFLKKLTWKHGRPLLLKSPHHTCRIRLLLEMFPEARFIHIHRNPYKVFQSSKRQNLVALRTTSLQHSDSLPIDDLIIRRYQAMYDVFFEERGLIPDARYHEVCYEELERDPAGQVRQIYEKLNLPSFDAVQPALQRYLDTIRNYHKNEYPELPVTLRGKIARSWEKSFEVWGYAM
jgi:hypothetical protein